MIKGSCHCGAITMAIAAPPAEVTDCNCSICRRYGVLWAYYTPDQVQILSPDDGEDLYLWGGRRLRFHLCRDCGCVTHWSAVDPQRPRMGVNARMLSPAVLAAARLRRLDGAGTCAYLDE